MKILVCYNRGMKRHEIPLSAFAEGARKEGNHVDEVVTQNALHKIKGHQLVVLFGSGDNTRGFNARVKYDLLKYCDEYKIPFIKLEEAFIYRDEYWAAVINGLGRDGQFLHKKIDSDRISKITTFNSFKWKGDCILITKQLERDANVDITPKEYHEWLNNITKKLVQLDYPIVIREHPKIKLSKTTIREDLENARMVVTYSSNTAVDAAIAGVPFYVESPRSVVYPLRVDIKDIDGKLPSVQKQHDILNEVAHAQWTVKEMYDGQCWRHLCEILKTKNLCNEK